MRFHASGVSPERHPAACQERIAAQQINGHEARWVARLSGGARGRTELSDAPDATGGAPRLDTSTTPRCI
jgi:ABC-type nitrate/sulfonate/bicarbonate transport system ATPase subunit